jgi:hypothetical protein
VIPQKVMPWSLPIVDNDVIETYLRMPSRFKLNGSVFRKMLTLLCPKEVCGIPDSNTGAPVNCSGPTYALHRFYSSLRNRIVERILPQMATPGSWPNWRYYIQHSKIIESHWRRPNPLAKDIFTRILGKDPFQTTMRDYAGPEHLLFLRLLTQKIWLDQRSPAGVS